MSPQRPSTLSQAFREDLSKASAETATRLATLLRNAHVHGPNNDSWRALTDATRKALGRLVEAERTVTVELAFGQVLVNEHRVRPSFAEHSAYAFLIEALSSRAVGALRFEGVPSPEELVAFAYTMAQAPEDADGGLAALQAALRARGVTSFTLSPAADDTKGPASGRDRRARAVLLFFTGLHAVQEVMDGLRAGRSVGFRKVKRFVQELVELLDQQRSLALALTSIKNCGDYLSNHAVNVCVLSLVLGRELGFGRRQLADLGLAALLRDLGKATLDAELLEKPRDLSAEQWERFKQFPHEAVFALLRFRGFHEGSLRQVIVAFEHQFRSAAERTLAHREFNLYTRIAQIAGDFDAMTTPRPYRPTALTPHDALRMLVRDRHRTGADAMLLKAFLHALGLYPVGSLLLLDTRELAVVVDAPFDDASLGRPRVRLVASPDGTPMPGLPVVELTATDAAGRFPRSIAATIDPAAHGIPVPRLLLGL